LWVNRFVVFYLKCIIFWRILCHHWFWLLHRQKHSMILFLIWRLWRIDLILIILFLLVWILWFRIRNICFVLHFIFTWIFRNLGFFILFLLLFRAIYIISSFLHLHLLLQFAFIKLLLLLLLLFLSSFFEKIQIGFFKIQLFFEAFVSFFPVKCYLLDFIWMF
jgi:hypothetical protein